MERRENDRRNAHHTTLNLGKNNGASADIGKGDCAAFNVREGYRPALDGRQDDRTGTDIGRIDGATVDFRGHDAVVVRRPRNPA